MLEKTSGSEAAASPYPGGWAACRPGREPGGVGASAAGAGGGSGEMVVPWLGA